MALCDGSLSTPYSSLNTSENAVKHTETHAALPVLGIMTGASNQPPAMVPARGQFLAADLQRNAALFQAPLLPLPSNFFEFAGTSSSGPMECGWRHKIHLRLTAGLVLSGSLGQGAPVLLVSHAVSV